MADNIELNAGSGGAVLAADDIAGVWYQIIRPAFGPLGTSTLVTASVGLPVEIVDADQNIVDDAAFTPATSVVSMAGFEFDDTTPDSVDEGDAGAARMSANRNIYTTIRDAAGNERGANVDANNAILVQEAAAMDVSAATVTVDGSGVTQPVSGTVTANLSATDNAVLDTIDAVLDLINAKLVTGTVIGDVNLGATDNAVLDSIVTNQSARSTGGCKVFTSIDLDQTEEDITSGATTIYGIYVWNATAAPLWLQLFNTNTVTVGTTAPTNNFPIPANADSDVAGVVIPIPDKGAAYSTALTVAITTGSGTDNGAPGAGDAGIVVLYQD